jgi:DNA-binding response OmpR family regulator
MKRILIIEDDPAILKAIKIALEQAHHDVYTESDGEKGYIKAQQENIDLILLDLMLPNKNGEDICRDLRAKGITTPIIVITARKEEIDEVTLLKLGADDYLTKPVSIHKLLARVEKELRRLHKTELEIETYSFGFIDLDFKKQEAARQKKPIKLSAKEFEIIRLLIQREGEVVSRDELLDKVWGYDEEYLPTTRTVDNYILNLRKKIEDDPTHPKHLLTMHKSGYKFVK